MTDTDNNTKTTYKETAEEEAKRLGVSVRTIYRRRAKERQENADTTSSKSQTKTLTANKAIPKPQHIPSPAAVEKSEELEELLPITIGGSEKMLATMVEAWTKMLDIQREQIQRMDKVIELLVAAVNNLTPVKDAKKGKKVK